MKKISFFSLLLLMIAAIDSIRDLPATSLFRTQIVFFFILGAFIFLLPLALCSAELAAKDNNAGGVYNWVLKAFGHKWAMVAIWLQWINTIVWYPTILSFIAATIAYLIDPTLVQSKLYLMGTSILLFWFVTVINLGGLSFTLKVNTITTFLGIVIPLLFLIFLGLVWWFTGHPLAIKFDWANMIPEFGNINHWVSLVAIMASFVGLELSGVHIADMEEPHKNFPKAIFITALFILVTMLLGSLSIAIVLPHTEICLVSGVMQVFNHFFSRFHLEYLTPVLAILIVLGTTGGIINWVLSPVKGLFEAAKLGYLPKHVLRTNRAGIAHHMLIYQALAVTLFCSLFLFIPSINSFYWFLTALSTELYMGMYILMFLAVHKLRHVRQEGKVTFTIPGKNIGRLTVITLGLFGCLITMFVSFFPPDTLKISSVSSYCLWILTGNIVTLAPLSFFFYYKKRMSGTL